MSDPQRARFDFALPKGVQPPENAARPNWCGAQGCDKTAEAGTARCAACRDAEFTERIKARKAAANEEGDSFALGQIDREVHAWRAKGRRFFG